MSTARRLPRPAAFAFALAATLVSACATAAPASQESSASAAASASEAAAASPTPMPTLAPGVEAVFQLGFKPSGISASDKWIWAEDHSETNAVYAIDPETGATVAAVSLRRPCDVVVAADGSVWTADLDAGEVLSLDPMSGDVLDRTEHLSGPCGLQTLAGAVWFAVDNGLARLDPAAGTVTTAELGTAGFPGSGRPMWVAMYGTDKVGQVDPSTGEVSRLTTIPGGATEFLGVASGFGSVWVGHGTESMLYRLDPSTGEIEAEIAVASPGRLLVTDVGVWITSYATGIVERVDPSTNEVVFHTEIGGSPNGITEGFGSIWVARTGSGTLYRIDPTATTAGE